jgi:metal-responsive CopG/Arc/MetJ family transcriptional regulator
MDKVLKGGELRSAFIRAAIEAELQRRESAVHVAAN